MQMIIAEEWLQNQVNSLDVKTEYEWNVFHIQFLRHDVEIYCHKWKYKRNFLKTGTWRQLFIADFIQMVRSIGFEI